MRSKSLLMPQPVSAPRTGRRELLALGGLGLAALLSGCATPALKPSAPSDVEDETAAFLPMVNALRQKNGKPALVSDPQAAKAAMFQANRMAQAEKMAHLIGMGDSFGARMRAGNVQLPAAENVAMLQQTADAAMQAWINSSHHLENMLGPYHGLGVAVARIPSRGNKPYWAMVLSGTPRPESEMGPPPTGIRLRIG
ncbi:CAP domain-containing protein [Agrobacterium vitis]|uniref:CAP domain-containing protein n=1 Tax=Agrobacterium vitis TaxID=373 RepID=UPI003B528918